MLFIVSSKTYLRILSVIVKYVFVCAHIIDFIPPWLQMGDNALHLSCDRIKLWTVKSTPSSDLRGWVGGVFTRISKEDTPCVLMMSETDEYSLIL